MNHELQSKGWMMRATLRATLLIFLIGVNNRKPQGKTSWWTVMNKHHSPQYLLTPKKLPVSTHQFCTSKKKLPMQSQWLCVTFLLEHFHLHSLPCRWLFSAHAAGVTNSRDSVAHSRNRELCPSLLEREGRNWIHWASFGLFTTQEPVELSGSTDGLENSSNPPPKKIIRINS